MCIHKVLVASDFSLEVQLDIVALRMQTSETCDNLCKVHKTAQGCPLILRNVIPKKYLRDLRDRFVKFLGNSLGCSYQDHSISYYCLQEASL